MFVLMTVLSLEEQQYDCCSAMWSWFYVAVVLRGCGSV